MVAFLVQAIIAVIIGLFLGVCLGLAGLHAWARNKANTMEGSRSLGAQPSPEESKRLLHAAKPGVDPEAASNATSLSSSGANLHMTFALPDKSTKTINFAGKSPPLGLDISPDGIAKCRPGGVARELGVCDGWTVAAVNETQVDGLESKIVKDLIKRKLFEQQATNPALVLGFITPDGTPKTIDFGKPKNGLGITFSKGRPCRVNDVQRGSIGDVKGVREGMLVLYVNGQHVGSESCATMPLDAIKQRLKEL